MDSPLLAKQSAGEPVDPKRFWRRIPLLWRAAGSAVTLGIGVLTFWHQLPHPHAAIAKIWPGDRLTHAEYLANRAFNQVADNAYQPTAPYARGMAQRIDNAPFVHRNG